MAYTISREIGIDMGHRVPTHGSKCANFHGHRYRIIAECAAIALQDQGEQTDMIVDFGFLKEAMMHYIDRYYDHGLVLYKSDPYLEALIGTSDKYDGTTFEDAVEVCENIGGYYFEQVKDSYGVLHQPKLMMVNFIPTAERLAEYWAKQLIQPIKQMSKDRARLTKITVWETPNCSAEYVVP